MKNLMEITKNLARRLLNDNGEYLVWIDGSDIECEEIVNEFGLNISDNGIAILEHKTKDFRIEDIII